MEESVNPTITLGPVTFDLTLLAMSLLTVLIVFAFVYWASRKMTLKPSGKQNVLEYLYDFVIGFTKGNIGDKYMKNYSLFIFSLFLFVAVANNLGLTAKVQTTKGYNLWTSPTANLAFDLGFSFLITLICHIEGIRRRGVKAYLKAFATPGEVLSGLLATLSHQAVFWYPVAFVLNLIWTAFSVFISCIQAYVFTMLTSMYLGKKINGEE